MKPALLVLHGALGSDRQLEPLARKLSEYFQVYRFNFSGHGGEPVPPGGKFSMDVFVADILNYLNRNSLRGVPVFGYSMGGYAALCLASKDPAALGPIFTLATKFDWNEASSSKEAALLDPEKIRAKVPAFAAELEQRHSPCDWKQVLFLTAAMMQEMGRKPPLTDSALSGIGSKVRIAVGENDKMVTVAESERVAKLIPGAEFGVLAGQPHPIEQIDAGLVINDLTKFLHESGVK